jgi:hypothetical protein
MARISMSRAFRVGADINFAMSRENCRDGEDDLKTLCAEMDWE